MKLVRESLYNFNKTGDVKSGLNIGMRAKITAWLDEMEVENYTINEDYSIDVNGSIDLTDRNLESFPNYIKFNIISGGFFCDNNQLTSLEGAPEKVAGSFWCDGNQLTSLEGAPQQVEVNFSCSDNRLTSLEGAPKEVGGDFWCQWNKIKFSEEEVREVCNVKGKIYT